MLNMKLFLIIEERKGWARMLDEALAREKKLEIELDLTRNLAQGLWCQLEAERTQRDVRRLALVG